MRSGGLRNNGEAMREQARSAERPSEPQANGLTTLLEHSLLIGPISHASPQVTHEASNT